MEAYAAVVGTRQTPNHRLFQLSNRTGDEALIFPFWVLKSSDRVILVDTGFSGSLARQHGVNHLVGTKDLLKQVSVDVGDVDDVIISHLHYDHCAELDIFPRAIFHVQRRDLDYFTGRGKHHPVSRLTDEPTLRSLLSLQKIGRVNVLDVNDSFLHSVVVTHVGGHTPGSQVVSFRLKDTAVVLACDAAHTYENLYSRTTSTFIHDYDEYQRGFATIEMLARDGLWFPGHDPRMLDGMNRHSEGVWQIST